MSGRGVILLGVWLASACGDDHARKLPELRPGPNPMTPADPLWAPQPHRDHPDAVVVTPDGAKVYVTLAGVEDEPGHDVVVVDAARRRVLRRIPVGAMPTGLALDPSGRHLVVASRYAAAATVIDTRTDEVEGEIAVPYHTAGVLFAPDGRRLFFSNRWKDAVLIYDVDVEPGDGLLTARDPTAPGDPRLPAGVPTGVNPDRMAVTADAGKLFVANLTGLDVAVVDPAARAVIGRIALNSPPADVAVVGDVLYVLHTGRGTQHPPDQGFDTDGDGHPGDGTANVMFQDLQNEIEAFDVATLASRHRYTSDSICCFDYRDVDPDRPTRGALLPPPDTWPASRVAYLPPRASWIVAGALPERLALVPGGPSGAPLRLAVVFSGSNELQTFTVAADGALAPVETAASGLRRTGMNPRGVAAAADGKTLWVADRLGETLTRIDLDAAPGAEEHIVVGDVSGGAFPATDAEIGEAVNFVTAPFTVDGDQTCVHCHREGGNLAKAIAMPLQTDPVFGTRQVQAYRGAYDTRPWFLESAMDETNFFPVLNEFNRRENFCCEGADPLVWGKYPKPGACAQAPDTPGCHHVLACEEDPPPECAERPYGGAHAQRNQAFRAAARRLFGRDTAFGDALSVTGSDGTKRGIVLDFDGITRTVGLFLLQRPRLLPNPNAALPPPDAARGAVIFRSAQVGCGNCHPLPTGTVSRPPFANPFNLPLRFPPVISPRRNPDTGANADRITPGFLQTFSSSAGAAEQSDAGVHFGPPTLRGLWDRAPTFFHDGRTRSLREALVPPGHPSLRPGERGFNERDGMPDTHGVTGFLQPDDVQALEDFLLTL